MQTNIKQRDKTWVYFEYYSIEPVSQQEALLRQSIEGYPHMGYGFEGFKCETVKGDEREMYKVSWRCYRSCD